MTDYQGAAQPTLSGGVIEKFKASLHGELIRPDSGGYDEARTVWNGMIDRRPALIVRCAGLEDVQNAVRFARSYGLLTAVRGGGHNAAGFAVCDGGLVIDLSRMRGIRVDQEARTARAQAGATWGDFDRESQAFGLATTGGSVSMTGIAGLTLGGGLGWLMRSYGLACDNLLSVELVSAAGQVLTASPNENPDLFWGVRGGGGNFGVVTSFEYRLHPVGPVLGGLLIHPLERARKVLQFYREFSESAPDELTVFAALMTTPDGIPVIGLALCYNGPLAVGEKTVHALRSFGPPLADQVGSMPYTAIQSLLDAAFPAGLQVYWRSDFLQGLGDETLDMILSQFAKRTSPLSVMVIEQFGGAVSRVGREDTAFEYRDAPYNLAIISRWTDPGESDTHIRWARGTWEAMRPFASGVYVNYLGEEGEGRVKAAYGPAKYERLVALKNKYDPGNFFRLNQNIKPAG
jgi:FAD/FMN-containing dehydrogenase